MRKLAIAMALASTALATPAVARDNSWYVGVEGGPMIVEDIDLDYDDGTLAINDAINIDHNTGFDVDLIGGYDFGAFRVEGEIAVRAPDPVMFLGYWDDPATTEAKVRNGWLLTGDIGRRDAEGFVEFVGRDDDVITSAGYRIGPAEIEDCLSGHPAVRLAAVIGKPDPLRTEIVKAYVVLREGHERSERLAAELRDWVKHRLSMHEYPREVDFVDDLPLTTSGKVIRRMLRLRAAAE